MTQNLVLIAAAGWLGIVAAALVLTAVCSCVALNDIIRRKRDSNDPEARL